MKEQNRKKNMNITKALKVKNAILRKLIQKRTIFARENSRINTENDNDINFSLLSNEINKLVADLIDIKTKIAKANVNIYEKIIHMAELKTEIVYLKELNVTSGTIFQNVGYNNPPIEKKYVAFINEKDRDALLEKLQSLIETIQDDIDLYNATTNID